MDAELGIDAAHMALCRGLAHAELSRYVGLALAEAQLGQHFLLARRKVSMHRKVPAPALDLNNACPSRVALQQHTIVYKKLSVRSREELQERMAREARKP